jgi:hypothetical protein
MAGVSRADAGAGALPGGGEPDIFALAGVGAKGLGVGVAAGGDEGVAADEAMQEAVDVPSGEDPHRTWRVVLDARLQLQRTTGLFPPVPWENAGNPFSATDQIWKQEETFGDEALQFYRLLWIKE